MRRPRRPRGTRAVSRQVFVADEWRPRLAQAGLDDLALLLDGPLPPPHVAGQWRALTKAGLGGRERWRWELDANTVIYVKRYRSTPLREQIDRMHRQTVRHGRAWWEFHQAGELARQYMPAVRAIGVAEEMRGCWETSGAVLFEQVAGDGIDRLWNRLTAASAPITSGMARHDMTNRLARFVSALHQTGVCHRDLYLCHVFAELDADGRLPPKFTLIDLARTHRPYWSRARWLIKDLSQLDVSARQIGCSRTDRLRFLLAYLGLEPRAPRARWYARRIVRKSDGILRRLARKSGSTGSPA